VCAQPTKAAWKKIGEALEQARVELSPRYRNRTLFAQERGIDYRLAYDVEMGARDNYRRPTLRAVEAAYGRPYGWIDAMLDPRPDDCRFPGDPEMDRKAAAIWAARFDDQGRIMTDDAARIIIGELAAMAARETEAERDAG
jgi:hypothetical protein